MKCKIFWIKHIAWHISQVIWLPSFQTIATSKKNMFGCVTHCTFIPLALMSKMSTRSSFSYTIQYRILDVEVLVTISKGGILTKPDLETQTLG
jgi:hypothetical protein